jgi:hypothetical protein
MLYDSQPIDEADIYAAMVEILDYTMTRDGQVLPVIVMTNLGNSADTFTIYVETFDAGSNSLGRIDYSHSKNTSSVTRYRIQLDPSIFLPSGYRVKVSIRGTNSGDTEVYGTCYLVDPNCATDLIALEGQSLGSKVGDNFNTLFQNGGNTSTKVLADLATPDDVNDEVVDVVNVQTLIDDKTIAQALQIIAAVVAGKVSGAGTGTETFTGLDGTTERVEVEVNAEGDRTDVTYS